MCEAQSRVASVAMPRAASYCQLLAMGVRTLAQSSQHIARKHGLPILPRLSGQEGWAAWRGPTAEALMLRSGCACQGKEECKQQ